MVSSCINLERILRLRLTRAAFSRSLEQIHHLPDGTRPILPHQLLDGCHGLDDVFRLRAMGCLPRLPGGGRSDLLRLLATLLLLSGFLGLAAAVLALEAAERVRVHV